MTDYLLGILKVQHIRLRWILHVTVVVASRVLEIELLQNDSSEFGSLHTGEDLCADIIVEDLLLSLFINCAANYLAAYQLQFVFEGLLQHDHV